MIEAKPERGAVFVARLAAKARALAKAHAENRRRDPRRWRRPGLLWPLFAKEP